MASRQAILSDNLSYCVRRRLLLLLSATPTIQQTVQLESEPLLYQKALREVEDDDQYNPVDQANANKSE